MESILTLSSKWAVSNVPKSKVECTHFDSSAIDNSHYNTHLLSYKHMLNELLN